MIDSLNNQKSLFFKNAINVYSDSSVIRYQDNWVTACGFISTYNNQIIDSSTKSFTGVTNNYGEIYGIYMGIKYLIENYKNDDIFLNLFSDSRISVLGLTTWIFKWLNLKEGVILKRTGGNCARGKSVLNQEIFLEIMRLIIQNNVHINLWHIHGHTNSTGKSFLKFKSSFNKINCTDIILPDEFYKEMIYYNDKIDNLVKFMMKESMKNNTLHVKNKIPVVWIPNDLEIQKYKNLIN